MEHSSSMTTGDVTSVPEYVKPENGPALSFETATGTLYMLLANSSRGAADIHSCAYDMLLFDRALIGGKLINESSLAEMFKMDMDYGCGWVPLKPYDDVYYHGGESWVYKAYNMYCPTEKYGDLYLVQLHSSTACDDLNNECLANVAMASRT